MVISESIGRREWRFCPTAEARTNTNHAMKLWRGRRLDNHRRFICALKGQLLARAVECAHLQAARGDGWHLRQCSAMSARRAIHTLGWLASQSRIFASPNARPG